MRLQRLLLQVALVVLVSGALGRGPALGQPLASIPDTLAAVNGQKISRAALVDMLGKRKGGEVLDRLIEFKLIEQEMSRRRVAVSDEAVNARIKIMNQTRLAGGRESFEDAVRKQGQDMGLFRRGIRMQVAMETMAKADLHIPAEFSITSVPLEKWYKALRDQANIVGRRELLPPGIFATVNGEAISVDEFNDLVWANSMPEERAVALDGLIRRELVNQALQKKGIVVTNADLENEMARLERAYSRSAEFKGLGLDDILRQRGLSRAQLRADPDFVAAVGLRMLVRADVTEDQARQYFRDHELEYSGGQLRVSQIFLSALGKSPGQTVSQAALSDLVKKANDLKRQIDGGADFAALARQFSDDRASAAQGGDLGFIPRYGKLVDSLSQAVFALKKGEVSEPILTPVGYCLFKVTDMQPGPKTDFEAVKAEVYEDLVNSESPAWYDKLVKSAQIERAKL